MTDLITADLHLNDNPRDEYRWQAVESIRKALRRFECENLFILGDLTDDKDNHSAQLVNRIVDLLSDIAAECEVTIVAGNHDAVDPSCPFFRFLENIRNVSFITETTSHVTEASASRVLLVPTAYYPPTDALAKEHDAILTHATFAGALANGFKLDGYELPTHGVPIISGDIHTPQRLKGVTYVGAPHLCDFGDDYEPRVLLLDEGVKLRSLKIVGRNKRIAHVSTADNAFSYDKQTKPGDIVKVTVEVQSRDVNVAELREQVYKWGEKMKVTVHSIAFEFPRDVSLSARAPVYRNDADVVRAYAVAHKFDKATTAIGLSLIKG